MKQLSSFRVVAYCAIAMAVMAANARADFITAYGWNTTAALAGSATAATPGSLALPTCHNGVSACTHANADVTFTTTGVNFSTTNSTIAAWIASNFFPVNNLIDATPGALVSNTIWEFLGRISVTGTVAAPQSFSVQHDDGASFFVNGQTVINAPGPTSPAVTTGSYTGGANGNAPFDLIYSECCGGPAVLSIGLLGPAAAPVPDPSSILLLVTACAGVGISARRKLRMR